MSTGALIGILKGTGAIVVGAERTSADYRIEVFRGRTVASGLLAMKPGIVRAAFDQGAVQFELEDGTRIAIRATAWHAGGFVDFETSRADLPGY